MSALRLLVLGAVPEALSALLGSGFEPESAATLDALAGLLAECPAAAVLLQLPDASAAQRLVAWAALSQAVLDAAVVVVVDGDPAALDADLGTLLLEHGVQDVLPQRDATGPTLARVLALAVVRKRLERAARQGQSIDLATGLPSQAQLQEHMSHLLALREREPAPMALLVIRIEGLATAAAALGPLAAGALRRKVAVRLRATLRASDVVAVVGADAFAALLAWIDAPAAAERVAAKLVRALQRPLRVAGEEQAVAVSIGIAHYPTHGKEAQALMRQAFADAAGAVAIGRAGFANHVERGPAAAANDEPG